MPWVPFGPKSSTGDPAFRRRPFQEEVDAEFRILPVEIDPDCGAMVVYCHKAFRGGSVGVRLEDDEAWIDSTFASVVERQIQGRTLYAAVFPQVKKGTYEVYLPEHPDKSVVSYHGHVPVTVVPRQVVEVDLRYLRRHGPGHEAA